MKGNGTSPPPRLELLGATRRFSGRVALQEVTLTFEPGERVVVAGPSGAGKSTLLRLLSGAVRPSEGRVAADGVDLSTLSGRMLQAHRSRCGIVEQGSLLVPQLSVHRNVLAGRLAHWPWYTTLLSTVWPLEQAGVRSLLLTLGIEDRQWDNVSGLSGGQQQRVAIARGLVSAPSIILADEPTAALDPTTAAEIIDLLVAQTTARGATLVLCTHRLGQSLHKVDRLVGLRDGRVVLDAPSREVTDVDLGRLYDGSRERN